VKPEMTCIWLKAERRRHTLPLPRTWREEFDHLRPPVDNTLEGTSSWKNLLTGRDRVKPLGWVDQEAPVADDVDQPALSLVETDRIGA
jgi:hypothetical protein